VNIKNLKPFSSVVSFILKKAKLSSESLKTKYSTVLRVGVLISSIFFIVGILWSSKI
jgi:hypothetical protein